MAPGNADTLRELTDPELRPVEVSMDIPEHFYLFHLADNFQLDPNELLSALRSAGRGSAQDLGGARYEHYRVMIEDEDMWGTFVQLCQSFSRADVPPEVMAALRLGRMTALKKENGKVRGIVAGSILRRLVCKTVAR